MFKQFKPISILFILLFFNMGESFSQTKGLYVNDFKFIIGDTAEENVLLDFAVDHGYSYLILYNLYHIHNNLFDITDSISALPLSNFISNAKTNYGIMAIAGVGETFSSFDNIHNYNLDHINTPNERIDIYNLEFEFWNGNSTGMDGYYCDTYLESNGFSCDTAGAFSFILPELCKIDSLCDEYDWLNSEIYIGKPTELQAAKLAKCVDRVLVHYYRASDVYGNGNSIYNYKKYRLPALTDSVSEIAIMPIFSGCDNFMGPWLVSHSENKANYTWWYGQNSFSDETDPWVDKINIDGYVWYKYSCMYDAVPLAFEHVIIEGEEIGNTVLITWDLDLVLEIENLKIQRSRNLNDWKVLDTRLGTNDSWFLDEEVLIGEVYYRLSYFDDNGNEFHSNILFIDRSNSNLFLYPNPTSGILVLKGIENTDVSVDIYDVSGKVFVFEPFENGKLDLSVLNNGIYYLKLKKGNKVVFKRIIILK